MKGVIKIWKERDKVLEGIINNVFRKADVEHIAAERMSICETCPDLDKEGNKCIVPGTGPCCGVCGCSLGLKTRALSAACDNGKWIAVLSEQEQIALDMHLAKNDNPNQDETDIRSNDTHVQDREQ
jgi:hypothetical protein